MKLCKSLFFCVLALGVLIHRAHPRPCGLVKIISDPQKLDKSTFVSAQQNFSDEFNGRTITIFGWVMLAKGSKNSAPIVDIRVLPNLNEKKEDVPITFDPFAAIYLRNAESSARELVIKVAETQKDYRNEIVASAFKDEQWLFFAYSADYSTDSVVVYMSNLKDLEVYKEVKVSYKEFVFRQRLAINIGCSPGEKATSTMLTQCMEGQAQHFSYILDFFKNPRYLYILTTDHNNDVVFMMDNYNQDPSRYVSKDKSRTQYQLLYHKDTPTFLDSQKDYGFNNDNIKTKGGTTIAIPKGIAINNENFVDSPTIYVKFNYTEPLIDDFMFLYLRDSYGHIVLDMQLVKMGDDRAAVITLSDKDVPLITPAIFKQGTKGSFAISIIKRLEKIGVMFYTFEGTLFSAFVDTTLSGSFDIIFFDSSVSYQGAIQLIQINLLETAAGAIFNEFRDKYSRRNLECATNCSYLATLDVGRQTCVECGTDTVYNPQDSKCLSYCPISNKNLLGSCASCKTEKCLELDSGFFAANKISDFKVAMTEKKKVNGFKNDYADRFIVAVADSELGKQYNYTIDVMPQNRTAIYTFTALSGFDLNGKNVSISLSNNTGLFDDSRNVIQNEGVFIILLGIVAPNNDLDVNTPNVTKPNHPVNPNSENSRLEKRNDGVENSFRIFGIFGCIALWITVGFGLLGLLLVNPNIQRTKFLYQKFVQSFLMFQFMAFWVFYNSYLPYNLLKYLEALYQYSTGWHNIFTSAARKNHGNDDDFAKYLLKNTHRRFYEENLVTHFVLSFGFVLLIQLIIIFVYGLVKALVITSKKRRMSTPQNQENEHLTNGVQENGAKPDAYVPNTKHMLSKFMQSSILSEFEWMLIATVFLIFTVEVTLYAVYNFYGPSFKHSLFTFSFILAIIWTIIILVLLLHVLTYPFKPNVALLKSDNNAINGFIHEGLRLTILRKNFQGIQYLFYMCFAITLVVAYNSRLSQSIITYCLFLAFLIYVLAMMPPETKFDRMEQIVVHVLLLVSFTFLIALVYDDSVRVMSPGDRWILGYFVAIFSFFVILWNMCIVVWKVMQYIINLITQKGAKGDDTKARSGAVHIDEEHLVEEETKCDGKNGSVRNPEKYLEGGSLITDIRMSKRVESLHEHRDPSPTERDGSVLDKYEPALPMKRQSQVDFFISDSDSKVVETSLLKLEDMGLAPGYCDDNEDCFMNRDGGLLRMPNFKKERRKNFLKAYNDPTTSDKLNYHEIIEKERKFHSTNEIHRGSKGRHQIDESISFADQKNEKHQFKTNYNNALPDNRLQLADYGLNSDYDISAFNKPAQTLLSKDMTHTVLTKTLHESFPLRGERMIDSKLQGMHKLESLKRAEGNTASVLLPDSDISITRLAKTSEIKYKYGNEARSDIDKRTRNHKQSSDTRREDLEYIAFNQVVKEGVLGGRKDGK